jgi:hypothetical protein
MNRCAYVAIVMVVGLAAGCGGSSTSPSATTGALVYNFTGRVSAVNPPSEPSIQQRFRVGDPLRMTARIGAEPTSQPTDFVAGRKYMPVSGSATFGEYTIDADPTADNYVIVRNDVQLAPYGLTDQLLVAFVAFAPAAPAVGTLTLDFVSLNLLGPGDLWGSDSLLRSLPSVSSFRHFNLVSLSFRDAEGTKFAAEVGATITSATVSR